MTREEVIRELAEMTLKGLKEKGHYIKWDGTKITITSPYGLLFKKEIEGYHYNAMRDLAFEAYKAMREDGKVNIHFSTSDDDFYFGIEAKDFFLTICHDEVEAVEIAGNETPFIISIKEQIRENEANQKEAFSIYSKDRDREKFIKNTNKYSTICACLKIGLANIGDNEAQGVGLSPLEFGIKKRVELYKKSGVEPLWLEELK